MIREGSSQSNKWENRTECEILFPNHRNLFSVRIEELNQKINNRLDLN